MVSAVGGGCRALDELARDQLEALTFGRRATPRIGAHVLDVSEMAGQQRSVTGVEIDGDDRSLVLSGMPVGATADDRSA